MKSGLAAVVVLTSLGGGGASAGSLHWLAPLAECYDTGVSQKRAVVIIFYASVSDRMDADKMSIRLAMSSRMQALADATVWCMADVSRDVVAKNIGKALGVAEYPTLSVLAPNPNMIDETARVVGFRGKFAEDGFEGAQRYIADGVSKVQGRAGAPPKASAKR